MKERRKLLCLVVEECIQQDPPDYGQLVLAQHQGMIFGDLRSGWRCITTCLSTLGSGLNLSLCKSMCDYGIVISCLLVLQYAT